MNYDNSSKLKNEYSLKNSESQIMGQTQLMNRMPYKQIMPSKTPNNEPLLQTVRSDFNSFKNYSEINDQLR